MFTSPHRVSHLTFILYSLDLLYKVTYIFWALTCLVALPSYTALVSSSYTSSQNLDTHFLHFHFTMDSLCFSMWLAIYTSTTDFHRLVKRHACRTRKNTRRINFLLVFTLIKYVYFYITINVTFYLTKKSFSIWHTISIFFVIFIIFSLFSSFIFSIPSIIYL